MKIIITDNFNRDYISDVLVAENVKEATSQFICNVVNKANGEDSDQYWQSKPDDYKLYHFVP